MADPAAQYTAEALARRFELEVVGDGDIVVEGVCALEPGRERRLAFAETARQRDIAAASRASLLIVPRQLIDLDRPVLLVSDTPRLSFARVAAVFERPASEPGIAPGAVVAASAQVAPSASVGANAVIGERAVIGAAVIVGAGGVIESDTTIGMGSTIGPRAVIRSGTMLGERVVVGAGAVIGERGFGLVPGPAGLEAVPQLGGVRIEDDVEIGANSTIDRGAIDDTVVRTGVKIDNQVHVAHNCVIGAHTVIAGCTGIAGSCTIGSRCMIGGGVGIGDHVSIADGAIITAASQVPKDIDTEGVYSSTFRAMPARAWRKRLALFRALDRIEARLKRVETKNGISGDPL
ncbi:UDP-3-O-(3-hydroxymyristoyl)glucosamine N-acyltransferase [Salinisphaera sp.]|uniref:UDP-3-O-(3-hydroxymyristoyl)glucosamine N-acyltransferase n=1 Tax=Salinisphaera sp. TaxID=1914330 RepID=UPI002D78B8E1|nr:UDP-3-O-(3-hydroxymyristoyl)glucosamine N-acyltransferase [Salinisphaera sp.]HET7313875.1 UDP-3-O-(3-hydroxymyristoyl)glucosamine N-acyltransferase [Salinisphaera sp.]